MQKQMTIWLILCLTLGLQDGYLVLREDNQIKHIFPYQGNLYTEVDRQLLQRGIPLPGKEDLTAVLEDYFS